MMEVRTACRSRPLVISQAGRSGFLLTMHSVQKIKLDQAWKLAGHFWSMISYGRISDGSWMVLHDERLDPSQASSWANQ